MGDGLQQTDCMLIAIIGLCTHDHCDCDCDVAVTWLRYHFLSLLHIEVASLTGISYGQEEFFDPVTCYKCKDLAVNTTCANPVPMEPDPDVELEPWVTLAPDLPTITCRKGACVKWTYYINGQLIMHRTCSEELPLNIMLNSVCKTERNGNGYLCMCPDDFCNASVSLIGHKLTTMVMFVTTLLIGLNWLL